MSDYPSVGETPRRTIPSLLAEIRGSNYLRAAQAAKELAKYQQPIQVSQIASHLLELLEHGRWPKPYLMRILLVRTLRELEAYDTVEDLLPWLSLPEDDDEEDAPLQYRLSGEVARTIGSFRDSRTIWSLEEAMEEALDHVDAWNIQEPNETEWNACNYLFALLDALGNIADPESLTAIEQLANHRFPSIQKKVAQSLLAWRAWPDEFIQYYQSLLVASENKEVLTQVVQSLGELGPIAAPYITDILQHRETLPPTLLLDSLYSIGCNSDELQSYIQECINKKEEEVRAKALFLQLQLELTYELTPEELSTMLQHSENTLRSEIIQSLKQKSEGVELSHLWWSQVNSLFKHVEERLSRPSYDSKALPEESRPSLEQQWIRFLLMVEKTAKYISIEQEEQLETLRQELDSLRHQFQEHNLDNLREAWEDSLFDE